MKMVIEAFLTHVGWKGLNRKAFVDSVREVPLLGRENLKALKATFPRENPANTSHTVRVSHAYKTINQQLKKQKLSSADYIAFSSILLLLFGFKEAFDENISRR